MDSEKDSVRVDQWLWAARFFKTRSMAQQALRGGKVNLNNQRAKPAKELRVDDELVITKGDFVYTIKVLGLSHKRLSPALAQALYQETEESRTEREAKLEQKRLERHHEMRPAGRPDKRQRRQIKAFKQG